MINLIGVSLRFLRGITTKNNEKRYEKKFDEIGLICHLRVKNDEREFNMKRIDLG